MRTVEFGRTELARWLLDHGADPHLTNAAGADALTQFSSSLAKDNAELARRLSGRASGAPDVTPIMAAAAGEKPDVLAALLAQPHELEARDARGFTALLHACRDGSAVCIRLLLKKGADPNAVSGHGDTALALALDSFSDERDACLDRLLGAGADTVRADGQGRRPSELAASLGRPHWVVRFRDQASSQAHAAAAEVNWEAHVGAARFVEALFANDRAAEHAALASAALTPATLVEIAGHGTALRGIGQAQAFS